MIAWTRGRRVVSLDLPSGLLHEPHVTAEATLTLAAPKRALLGAGDAVGALFLADLSIPPAAYERLAPRLAQLRRRASQLARRGCGSPSGVT